MDGKFTLAIFVLFQATFALSKKDYDSALFEKEQKKGSYIIVDVYADWCPTCKVQAKDLKKILAKPKFKDVKFLKLDFDNKKLVKDFEEKIGRPIPRQSTIVGFKGQEIKTFSVAEQGEKLEKRLAEMLSK